MPAFLLDDLAARSSSAARMVNQALAIFRLMTSASLLDDRPVKLRRASADQPEQWQPGN